MNKKLTTLMVTTLSFAFLLNSSDSFGTFEKDKVNKPTEEVVMVEDKEINIVKASLEEEETEIIIIDVANYFKTLEYYETNSKEELNDLILECDSYVNSLNETISTVIELTENDVLDIQNEINRVHVIKNQFNEKLQSIIAEEQRIEAERIEAEKWTARRAEYPIATKVWLFMKNELGWNDYICAGVMGNLMAETGGQTLNLKPGLYAGSYYGICQWSSTYYPQVIGTGLDTQLQFLKNTVKKEFDTYGKLYQSGMKYEDFIRMTGCRSTALAFAKVYERCNSKHYAIRQTNAEKAYAYFTK